MATLLALAWVRRSMTGRFCRVRARPAGRLLRRMASQAADGLVGVSGTHDVETGDGAQRREVLDRLVRRAVLAEADRVVGPHVGDRQLLDRGEPDRRPHVVGEHEERAAVRAGQPLQGDPVEDHPHAVLADAEVQRAAVGAALPVPGLLAARDEGGLALHGRVVGLGEVGRAAPQLGHDAGEGGQHLARGGAGGHALLGVGGELGQRVGQAVRQVAGDEAVQQRGAVPLGLAPRGIRLVPLPCARPCRAPSTLRAWARTARSTSKVFFGSKPSSSLVAAISASPRAEPCDLPVSCLVGAGQAMMVCRTHEGRLGGLLGLLEGREQRVDVLDVGGAVTVATPVDVHDVPAVGA